MSKKSSGSSSNMLLLGGLGVAAFMLFGNKSNAQSKAPSVDLPASGGDADAIPAAPKIVAVNSSSTESPTPTGIVSDEEGMEATGSGSSSASSYSSPASTTASSGEDSSDEDSGSSSSNGGSSSGSMMVDSVVSAGLSILNTRQAQSDEIPPLISTTLTTKEKTIIDKGVLSDALAIQRPDLYKAIFLRKHGRTPKALQAADAAIQNIQIKGNSAATANQKRDRNVTIKLSTNSGNMVKAAAHTGGGMAAMAALSTINAMQYATSGGKAPLKKPVHRTGSKGAHPQHKAVHHSGTAHHPASKHPVKHSTAKHPVRHKPAVHKKH